MRITIVGTGYVGLVTGACLSETGNEVTCLDINAEKIARLSNGEIPIYEPGLEEIVRRNQRSRRLRFQKPTPEIYRQSEVIFICVGTPCDANGQADLSAVLAVADEIGKALAPPTAVATAPVVVIKSTVPVGTNARVQQAIAQSATQSFHMASNPEFLKEGDAIADFNKPDRIVIGVDDTEAAQRLRELYAPFVRQGHPIHVMDIPSAEMVKYASNAMLATKISFINEIANLCENHGASIDAVRQGMCADKRIGSQFLYPGLGYGGSCFPKDVTACIAMGKATQTPTTLLSAVNDVNRHQRERFCHLLDRHLPEDLSGVPLAVWGLAFKPRTDDVREAPAITIIEHLLGRGAKITAFDPVATESTRQVLGDRIAYAEDPMNALDQAKALIICTEWPEFQNPNFNEMAKQLASRVIFDGRNLYTPSRMRQLGFAYHSIGRASV